LFCPNPGKEIPMLITIPTLLTILLFAYLLGMVTSFLLVINAMLRVRK
jgi:hypothetical protein